jgi:ribosomal protein L11 methyltransferase
MALWELVIEVEPAQADALGAELFAAGAGGFEERESAGRIELVAWAESDALLARIEAAAGRIGARLVVRQRDDDWRREWLRHLRQERVSPGFVVQPIGDTTPAPPGTTQILLRPELAFGVGSHPTTQLAAAAVERLCRARPGIDVLDVGTGTGVLAMIALLCGARHATGIDVDPIAVQAARANADLNRLGERCRFSARSLGELHATFDLVIANLEAPVLLELAPALAEMLAPRATLVVTGLMVERRDELLAKLGLCIGGEQRDGDWCLLELGS